MVIKMETFISFLAILTLYVFSVQSYLTYKDEIPNGSIVPCVCKTQCGNEQYWPAVGHISPVGSDARNPFGAAFKSQNLTWNDKLCKEDSDGDGWTNGYELGDPECKWTPGAGNLPLHTPKGHPGICQPNKDGTTKCLSELTTCTEVKPVL